MKYHQYKQMRVLLRKMSLSLYKFRGYLKICQVHEGLKAPQHVPQPRHHWRIGFGLIGLGAYYMRSRISRTFALVTAGITIIFLSSPLVLAIFHYVLTGDLMTIPGFIV